MRAKNTVIAVIGIIALASCSFAQGEFLNPGEHGLFASFAHNFMERGIDVESARIMPYLPYSWENYRESFSYTVGFSYKGKVDLTVASRVREYLDTKEFRATITYFLKRKTPWGLTGAGFIGGYSKIETSEPSWLGTLYEDRDDLVVGIKAWFNYHMASFIMAQFALTGVVLTTLEERWDGALTEMTVSGALVPAYRSPVRPYLSTGVSLEDKGGTDTYGFVKVGIVLAL